MLCGRIAFDPDDADAPSGLQDLRWRGGVASATTRGTMSRPISTEVVLFLIPFAVYALFLVATRRGLLDPAHWPLARLAWLVIVAIVLMLGSFIWFATFGGAPPEST